MAVESKTVERSGRGGANFTKATRDSLAREVANHCAFPGCPIPCFGPSHESPGSVSDTGIGCHIVAAADGPAARRVYPTMSDEVRRSPENGIWCCTHHGKLIDADDATYTVEALRAWKALAIRRAQLSQMLARPALLSHDDPDLNALAPMGLEVRKLAGSRARIRELFIESGAFLSWGDNVATAARDLAIEIVSNALRHGQATAATITVEARRFVVQDDGVEFDCRALSERADGHGGAEAVREIKQRFSGRLLINHRHGPTGNRTTIAAVKSRVDLMMLTHCFIDAEFVSWGNGAIDSELTRVADCDSVFIMPPEGVTYSDRGDMLRACAAVAACGKRPVIVMPTDTSDGVARMIKGFMKTFGDYDVLEVSDDESRYHRSEVINLLDLRRIETDRLRGADDEISYRRF